MQLFSLFWILQLLMNPHHIVELTPALHVDLLLRPM